MKMGQKESVISIIDITLAPRVEYTFNEWLSKEFFSVHTSNHIEISNTRVYGMVIDFLRKSLDD